MCEIGLKFGKFTEKEIKDVRSSRSDGDGFWCLNKDKKYYHITKKDGDVAIKDYLKIKDDIVFTLYHCRNASAGTVNEDNVQPFYSPKSGRVLCHNGTINMQDMTYLAFAKNVLKDCKGSWSDTRILFECIKNEDINSILLLLQGIDDNFVVIDGNYAYVIGKFVWDIDEKYIKKTYGATDVFSCFDITSGKLLSGDKIGKNEAKTTTYYGYSSGLYGRSASNDENVLETCPHKIDMSKCEIRDFKKCKHFARNCEWDFSKEASFR